jgi:hypothetical protein
MEARSRTRRREEGVLIESAGSLCEELADVLEQHGSVYAPLPLLRRIDDRREDGLAAAACDHVVARCVGRGGGGLNVGRLAREEDGVTVDISLSLQSLIEEENVSHSNPLQLASHLGDLLTHVGRH